MTRTGAKSWNLALFLAILKTPMCLDFLTSEGDFDTPNCGGEPYALALNAPLIKEMALGGPGWMSINLLWEDFNSWLSPLKVGKPTVAGKNVASFDRRFLALAPKWDWGAFSRRFLDPGSLFLDPKQDLELPDLTTCASRAGVDIERFQLHNAVDDARLVVEIVRAYYRGK